jgi:membrane associated rhomboid family serine protease
MRDFSEKIQLIFKPFALLALFFPALYSCFHWLNLIQRGNPLEEDMATFFIPMVLAGLSVFLWLRPRIRLLHYTTDRGETGVQLLVWIAIFVPTIIAQDYVISATGKLTVINDVSQIDSCEKTKYYKIKNHYVHQDDWVNYHFTTVSGKHSQYFNMYTYVAMPLYTTYPDTNAKSCKYWIGIRFYDQISNRLTYSEKDAKYREFKLNSLATFVKTDYNIFEYLNTIGNTYDRDQYMYTIYGSTKAPTEDPVIFQAVLEPFEERNGNTLEWTFASMGIGMGVFLLILLGSKLDEGMLENIRAKRLAASPNIKKRLYEIMLRAGYTVTPILIYLYVLTLAGMVLAGHGPVYFSDDELIQWGANFRTGITNGQLWRIVSAMFLHSGLLHMVADLLGLYTIGACLEPVLGTRKFLAAYMVIGVFAGISSVMWYGSAVDVGAIGAVLGLYGVYVALIVSKKYPKNDRRLDIPLTVAFLTLFGLAGMLARIDYASIIGGTVSGLAIGFVIAKNINHTQLRSASRKVSL